MLTNEDTEMINNIAKGEVPVYNIPKKLLKEEGVKEGIQELLANDGITLPKLNKTLKEQLKAKKAMAISKDSTIVYVPDNVAIDQALTKGYKLYGVLKDNNTNDLRGSTHITFNGDVNVLAGVVREMKELNKELALDTEGEVV